MTQHSIYSHILELIEVRNPLHYKKLVKALDGFTGDYYERADRFFTAYQTLLEKEGKTLAYAVDSYLQMTSDMMFEQISFIQNGRYSATGYEEVRKRVYDNPDIMDYYMHGLVLSNFLWKHHYLKFDFFASYIGTYMSKEGNYLEIGAGHGLFVNEVLQVAGANAKLDVVDISSASISMARNFIESSKVAFIHEDIFSYHPGKTYSFITMGDVLEHMEDPVKLMTKYCDLLETGGCGFITTPVNAAAIDHIYLFNNTAEIKEMLESAGLEILADFSMSSEDVSPEKAARLKVPVVYACFVKKK